MGFPLSDEEHAAIKARIEAQPELIVAAAIQVDWCGSKLIVMAERPGRHGNCISAAGRISGDAARGGEHGFVTNRGRFVGRAEAGRIVLAAEQGSPGGSPRSNPNMHLFSEDMWNDHEDENRRPTPRPDEVF